MTYTVTKQLDFDLPLDRYTEDMFTIQRQI